MGIGKSINCGLKLAVPILMASKLSVGISGTNTPNSINAANTLERKLNFNPVTGYEPRTETSDQAVIDIDQSMIEKLIDFDLIDSARAIYEHGGHSQSTARIHLRDAAPPRLAIPKDTKVVGRTDEGHVIQGFLIEDALWTDSTEEVVLSVEYETTDNQTIFCHLGGLALLDAAELDGCFAAEGILQILDFQRDAPLYQYSYTYDVFADTYNKRTIRSLSTEIDMSFGTSEHWNKFTTYYDTDDYADQWIQAALDAESTMFLNGNANFSTYEPRSRTDALRVAAKLMNIFMYVIRMMEFAQVRCKVSCGSSSGVRCDDTPVRAWDQAVAFYSGSLEGDNGEGDGILLYDLADRMCAQFKTCSATGDMDKGTAYVNMEIMKLFSIGQFHLLRRECSQAEAIKEQIVNLMTVPIIQANLLSAHVRNYTLAFEEVKSSTYAASILPIIHHCNHADAETIYSNLGLMQADLTVDVVSVKTAFEQNYGCMGVTCKMVGGVWEGSFYGTYSTPCDYQESTTNPKNPFVIAIIVLSLASVVALMVYAIIRHRNKVSATNRHRNRYSTHDVNDSENDVRPSVEKNEFPGHILD
jgi:hypothetical protein